MHSEIRRLFRESGKMNRVIFHVGAYNGEPFLSACLEEPSLQVFAFEPQPTMCKGIRKRSRGCDRYHLINSAVSITEGKAEFRVRKSLTCCGLSKLVEIGVEQLPEVNRKKMIHVKNLQVSTVRLDTVIKQYNVECIDFLKVDTEGHDMLVLESLGSYLPIVQFGVVEVALNEDTVLFSGQSTLGDLNKFMNDNGFVVTHALPHGPCLVDAGFMNIRR